MAGTRRRPGQMGPFIESYRQELLRLGSTAQTVRGLLQHVGALGRWMAIHDVEPSELNFDVLERFLESALGRRQAAAHNAKHVVAVGPLAGPGAANATRG